MNKIFDSLVDPVTKLKSDSGKLIQDFTKLKQIIDSCKRSTDSLNNRITPILNRATTANRTMRGFLTSLTKNFAGQIAYETTGVRPPSNYGAALGRLLASSIGGMRATGGNVTSGTSYIVGEKGPELFTPVTSGNITANNQMHNSSRPVNIVMNINADVESFRRSQNQIISDIKCALRKSKQ